MVEREHLHNQPLSDRPQMPASYGIYHVSGEGMLTWSFVGDRMAKSHNYWIATASTDGKPHVVPVWGIWLDESFYFATDPASRKGRNLAANPGLAVHLESGDEVVILEGLAEEVVEESQLTRFVDAYEAKYGFRPEVGGDDSIIYRLHVHLALAWLESDFPKTATRWVFENG